MTKAARIDATNPWVPSIRTPDRRALLGATVGPRNECLHGIDFVRVDGARWSAHQLDRIRRQQGAPALLDLPGRHTSRRHGTLTRSEFLVYAATESWEWINLRDLEHADELERARECLPERARISATISSPEVLYRHLGELVHHVDVLFVDETSLASRLDPRRWRDTLQATFLECQRHSTPCLILSELLPSMLRPEDPRLEEIGRLVQLLDDGCSGFVLDAETCDQPRAQSATNILRLITERRRHDARTTTPRAAARVGRGSSSVAAGRGREV